VYGYDQRLEVFCSHGVAMAGNEAQDAVVKGDANSFESALPPYWFMQRYIQCYVDEVKDFCECVRNDRPPKISGRDGRMAVVLGYAAWKSLHENRPVKVSECM
jgi:myo-inositol 2-dehydrogenase/D-chiro-inositol 1-dehydrogenase